ncbi:MAG: hypothetical protein FWH18_12875, partial [Marinilabiliaceae bacterium]|nr:hypothetical protein [Marinilabiliaceae bacterium]
MVRKLLFFGIICLLSKTSVANAQTYDPTNVAVINALITNNGLNATPDAPEIWNFATWNDETPRQITQLSLGIKNLTGAVSFAGLNALTELYCYDNNLSELDVSNNIALTILECGVNNLSELDVTNNTALTILFCYANTLSELDVTNNTALERLFCYANTLSELDVTNNIALIQLTCDTNNLSELDITNNTALTSLDCFSNNLSKLDVTNNTALSYLACFYNNLSELDIANNLALWYLNCENNNLSELDLSNLDNLTNFYGYSQNVALTLFENELDEYNCPIWLNSPEFGNNAISYLEGILTSSDISVVSSSFSVQTGKENRTLSGTMHFTYDGVGIFNKSMEHFTLYPNPAKDIIFVECEGYNTIKVYDMLGKEVLSQNCSGKTTID